MSYTLVERCRICGNKQLGHILSLGVQTLTGVFPKSRGEKITAGPVDLVRCEGSGPDACGLVQLLQTYDKNEMYGGRYGYRSGLNASMVKHLRAKAQAILKLIKLEKEDLVLDIGSNDGTLLSAYPAGTKLVGMDPTAERFRSYYPAGAEIIPTFFSADAFRAKMGGRGAKVVTSIAMFYDLDAPMEFARQVRDVLEDDGVWIFEQSHLGRMLETTSYDTVCHEHLEFYALTQLHWMLRRLDMKVVGLEFNDVNGGSLSVTAAKASSKLPECTELLDRTLATEAHLKRGETYSKFAADVAAHKTQLREFLAKAAKEGKRVVGYGASTKGNVILQYCGISELEVSCIGEVNQEKFGCFTPGSLIPIVSEAEAKAKKPDYLMVLPWHFQEFMLKKEEAYRKAGGKLLFPLPKLQAL